MEDGERRIVVGGAQVGEEAGQLGAREQRFIDDRATRQRAHEERLESRLRVRDAPLDGTAREVEGALERGFLAAVAPPRWRHPPPPDRWAAVPRPRARPPPAHGGVTP